MPSRRQRAHGTHGRARTTVRLLGRFVLIAGLTAAGGRRLAAQPDFPNPAIPVPSASDVAIADFNGDGIPDAAIGSYFPGGVVVALGRGDGSLVEAVSIPLEAGIAFVAAADVNRDARQDLIVASEFFQEGLGATWVILGRGDGSFLPPTRLVLGGSTEAVAVGDYNEDGNLDLAAIDVCSDDPYCASGEVWVAPGNGDGTFRPATGMPAGREPVYLVSGDFNEDGHLDLMVANTRGYYPEGPGDLSFLAGRGDGTFAPEQDVTEAVVTPHRLAVGDFNADGHTDLAGVNSFGHAVAIYLGGGDGTFAWGAYPTGDGPSDVVAGDFNGDGLQDLATANFHSDDLAVLPGRGDGTFGEPVRTSAADGPTGLGFADFDGDHRTDALVANANSGIALIVAGHGDGSFGTPQRSFDRYGHDGIALEDFDRDGLDDLLVSNGSLFVFSSGDLSLLRGLGNGSFGPETHFADGSNRGPLRVADFDEDGNPDVAVGNINTSEISVFLGRGDGTFGPDSRVPVGINPAQIVSGDLNGDDHVDLVVVNLGETYPTRVPPDISVLLGRGDGTFAPEVRFPAVAQPVRAVIADLNGDGKADLAVTSEEEIFDDVPGQLSTWFGRGDGTFDPGQVLTAGKGVFDVVAADVNGDGRLDLVANNRGIIQTEFAQGDLSLFLADGAGGFEAARRLETGGSPVNLAVADFDQDGRIDLVTANSTEDASVLFGGGDGTFEPPERFGVLDYPAGIIARDVTGDGRADLVAVGQEDFTVLPNQIAAAENHPPHASIDAPASVECSGPEGTFVVLDGSASFDPDSPSGESHGIVNWEWFLDPGTPGQTPLGVGVTRTVLLPLGPHTIGLRVTDDQGATGEAQAVVTVRDTVPPILSVAYEFSVLWPPNHRLVPARFATEAIDRCDPTPQMRLVSVTSSEPDDAPGDADGRTQGDIGPVTRILEWTIPLRAERDGDGPGRTYEVLFAATDASGNTVSSLVLVSVPHDQGQGPEPLSLRAEPAGASDGSTRLYWNAVNGARAYDLISGDLANLRMEPDRVGLGPVQVLDRLTPETSSIETNGVPPGHAIFYLVQYRDDHGPTGFSAESVPLPREPSSCDLTCPGRESEPAVATTGERKRR